MRKSYFLLDQAVTKYLHLITRFQLLNFQKSDYMFQWKRIITVVFIFFPSISYVFPIEKKISKKLKNKKIVFYFKETGYHFLVFWKLNSWKLVFNFKYLVTSWSKKTWNNYSLFSVWACSNLGSVKQRRPQIQQYLQLIWLFIHISFMI